MSNDKSTHKRSARLPGFYKLSVAERLEALRQRGLLNASDYQMLSQGIQAMDAEAADKMVENVLGVFTLPMGLGLNFLVNDKEYAVPLVVEEPSIIAALSSAAKTARAGGGFRSVCETSYLVGQIQMVDVPHPVRAKRLILQKKDELLNLANSLHPKMVARGGGAKDVEVKLLSGASPRGDMLVVHLLVDTCDAMGANLVNTMCEGVAPLLEQWTEGKVCLRILSNLTDRSLVRTKVVLPVSALAVRQRDGVAVRDGIILANAFALADPYRAATHNKGIMNGVDAVAIATGNDWRAIEAAAHAYAARGSHYTALTQWYADDDGNLVGRLEIPIKVGTVGAPLQSNPAVPIVHRLMGIKSARELAELMGAVGLAQNFSALRALATDGIQRGHMTLHARSVAMAAGAPPQHYDSVVKALVADGEIKVWKAKEIIASLCSEVEPGGADSSVNSETAEATAQAGGRLSRSSTRVATALNTTQSEAADDWQVGHGKVVLLGEHSVVYGKHAVAVPMPLAVRAKVEALASSGPGGGIQLVIPAWGVEEQLTEDENSQNSVQATLAAVLRRLNLLQQGMLIKVQPRIPRAMGLGGSAALAVAVVRALSVCFDLKLSDADVNGLAFEAEKVAHTTPSGVDNTLATYGVPLVFRRGAALGGNGRGCGTTLNQGGAKGLRQPLSVERPLHLAVGVSGVQSLTAQTVGAVRRGWEADPALYDGLFEQMDAVALAGVAAIETGDQVKLGRLMDVGHGLLNSLGVSVWQLEEMVQLARTSGALGAKLTGGGGGGAVVALCKDHPERVLKAWRAAGYDGFVARVPATSGDGDGRDTQGGQRNAD